MKRVCFVLLYSIHMVVSAQQPEWPVLKTYDHDHTKRIAMPIGGIGTGTVSLNGRGGLQDWEIMNRPAKGYNPWVVLRRRALRAPFFAIAIQDANKQKYTRMLEGPVPDDLYEGKIGAIAPNHGLPRFESSTFETTYPFARATLADEDMPVTVAVHAFNPLIPGNVDDSSIPVAILDYTVTNTSDQPLAVTVAGTIQNFIGHDGTAGKARQNLITYKGSQMFKGLHYTSKGVPTDSEQWGTLSLVTPDEGNVSYRTNWKPIAWGSSTNQFWDDLEDDGMLEDLPPTGEDAPIGSLANKVTLEPRQTKNFRFIIGWHFPNRQGWGTGTKKEVDEFVGNYYTNLYDDAWDVVEKTVPRLEQLQKETTAFVKAFIDSDMPLEVKEAALFNLSHLRTQLAFRIKTGEFMGFEGIAENHGLGFGLCTHVWNYEQTTPFLFGEIAKNMRDVEFRLATDEQGFMSFRVNLPPQYAQNWKVAAADGQMGTIMKIYRDWQLSGDDNFLKQHWPKVKKALEFCWIPKGWDADKDGVMEGAQHNTMDVEYFGPNPQMGFWYLGALKSASLMASHVGDKSFAKTCWRLFENGSKWMDENLFNGEYYEQEIRPPMSRDNIAPELLFSRGATNMENPEFQLGKGVLVDQLVGQVMAHISGLGYLGKEENMKKTHRSIMKYNYRASMRDYPNFMRTYALGDESALLMAAYPYEKPEIPFPYYSEVMTGFEYTAAVGMLYEHQTANGLKCIRSTRARYDGKKRNPFNEAEYGNHYARSMMAWGAVLAVTGFNYSAVDQSMSFKDNNGVWFWSNGYQYGNITISDTANGKTVALSVIGGGDITLQSFVLKGYGSIEFKKGITIKQGETSLIRPGKK